MGSLYALSRMCHTTTTCGLSARRSVPLAEVNMALPQSMRTRAVFCWRGAIASSETAAGTPGLTTTASRYPDRTSPELTETDILFFVIVFVRSCFLAGFGAA